MGEEEERSKILVIGVTGNLGFELAKASLHFCHPTFALVRHSSFSHPHKSHNLLSLTSAGATLLKVCVRVCVCFVIKKQPFLWSGLIKCACVFDKVCVFGHVMRRSCNAPIHK